MRGTDDHIDELNLLMGEIRALTEQRDRLAEALREVLEDHTQAGCISIEAQESAEAALAAVKGGSHE